jgi:hypothetical protein
VLCVLQKAKRDIHFFRSYCILNIFSIMYTKARRENEYATGNLTHKDYCKGCFTQWVKQFLLISLLYLPQNNNQLSFQHSLERVNGFLNVIYRKIELRQLNKMTYWNYYNFFIEKNFIGKYGHKMSKFSVVLSICPLTFSLKQKLTSWIFSIVYNF